MGLSSIFFAIKVHILFAAKCLAYQLTFAMSALVLLSYTTHIMFVYIELHYFGIFNTHNYPPHKAFIYYFCSVVHFSINHSINQHMLGKIILLFVLACIGTNAFTQDTISLLAKVPNHPRILLLKGEEKKLLKSIGQDPFWTDMHNTLLKRANIMLDEPLNERVMVGRRLLWTSRDVLHKVFVLSYAYRMTNNIKYSDRAVREMLQAASFSDWNPSHFLDVAEMSLAFAIGYDWNYNRLNKSDRATIKNAIFDKALYPSLLPQNNAWLKRSNNWNQVCNAGIALAALAVYEDNPTLTINFINRSILSLPNAMKVYAPDGGYPEGAGYWAYGTGFNSIFIDAIEKVFHSHFGLADMPGFMATGIFSQVMITPALQRFSHSDTGTKSNFEPTVFWFYKKTKDPTLLFYQQKLIEADTKKSYANNKLLPLTVLWGAPAKASFAKSIEPKNLMWFTKSYVPVAVMRSSWTDNNALYLGVKGGSPSAHHGHMDGGSFYFEANGVNWAMDLGTPIYETIERNGIKLFDMQQNSRRWEVFRISNESHNTLTINNERHLVKVFVPFEAVSTQEMSMSVHCNLSSLFENSIREAKRSISMQNKAYVLVEDIITTNNKNATVRWNMATQATHITAFAPHIFILHYNDKKLYIIIEGDIQHRHYFKPAVPTLTFELPNPGVSLFGFEFDATANETKQIKVYLMPEAIQNIVQIR